MVRRRMHSLHVKGFCPFLSGLHFWGFFSGPVWGAAAPDIRQTNAAGEGAGESEVRRAFVHVNVIPMDKEMVVNEPRVNTPEESERESGTSSNPDRTSSNSAKSSTSRIGGC